MHTILVVAILIGVALVALGMFSTGALDMISNALSINSMQITQLDIINYESESRISLTIKNTGSSSISNVTAIVIISNNISNVVEISGIIDKSRTGSVSEKLTISGTTNPMMSVVGQEVLVEISGVGADGSIINVNPVKTRVR